MFGDIGTSPITIQTAVNPNDPLPVPISTDNVYGVASLIFWSVMIIVTLTYVTLVMRADNDGGGSIMALITLLRRYGGARGRRTAMTLAALGLFGAALFFGESMITPAISPGSDQNSLNRGAGGTRRRRVGADNRRAGRRPVRGARGRPGALPLRLGGRPWSRWPRHHHSTRSARWRTMAAGGVVLAARGDTRSRPRARRRWEGEAMTVQDGLDIQVPQPALLFDLDGTLVDSVYQHVIAWQEALATCGIELSVWRIHRRIGMSGGLFIDALSRETGVRLDEQLSQRLRELHAQAYLRRHETVVPLPGARELLAHLHERQVPFAIATSGARHTAGSALALLGLPDDVPVVTRDLVERAKPDPHLFLAAARRLGVDPAHCFVVGDSVWDLLAAQRAGALGIGLLSGGYGREELERSGAYRVYADPAEMLTRLEEVGVRPIR